MTRVEVLGLVLLSTALGSCKVSFPAGEAYRCDTDDDCVDDALVCHAELHVCCRPSEELCDGLDNDCNGKVDDLPPAACYLGAAETKGVGRCVAGTSACVNARFEPCVGQVLPVSEVCNGLDDDCDGTTDEAFNLQTDPLNCGACGVACAAEQACVAGVCRWGAERFCADGLDDDGEGDIDCADADCNGQSCGATCVCLNGVRGESACGDGLDNEPDGLIDCLDPDCDGEAHGDGGLCQFGNETTCWDTLDNDGDGNTDCADSTCLDARCKGGTNTSTCNASLQCVCNGSTTPPQEKAVDGGCYDGLDNDCTGTLDCADSNCNAEPCNRDGGCQCTSGAKKETACNDLLPDGGGIDNDGDGKPNCQDTDCVGQRCNIGGTRKNCVAGNPVCPP